jgi:3-methyladenine DNA glycosylase/8-oxoguanine DNA glycosylase
MSTPDVATPYRSTPDEATRRMALPAGYDLSRTVGPLGMGHHDPCFRAANGGYWWATRTPAGAATLSLRREGGELVATGYGPGREWVLDRADAVAGLRDDTAGFAEVAARHPVVADVARRYSGVRLPATGRTFQRLLRAVFEQKVTGKEAYRAYAATVRHFHAACGREPAPGPVVGLLLPPDPAAVAATPYWVFHPFGVEQRRADALCRAAAAASRLEECTDAAEATRRLTAIPGIGAWTAAEVVRVVYGDPDAVSVGDYHFPHIVSWALAGQARAGSREGAPGKLSPADTRMLELLEPFRGHRGRVCALLEAAGLGAPRRGPRMPIRSFATF